MYKTIPKTQEHSTEFKTLERQKKKFVRSLFQKGRISTKTAAQWLGMSEKEFLLVISK